MEEDFKELKERSVKIGSEFREKSIGYFIGALGLVAGLAWNEAIRALIDYVFPENSQNGIAIKFFYALVITAVVAAVAVNLSRFGSKNGEKNI